LSSTGGARESGPESPAELRAAYRLQLRGGFGFAAARSLIPYLRDLGISHVYLSPSFQAREGSTHGYDVIDPRRLSDYLGGREEFELLAAAARQNEMGIVLDVVPNHMAVSEANRYWADLGLRERSFDIDPISGRHRRFFDIDDLAGVRQERPDVFEETHALAISLVRDGLVDGLRIDHPDGLANPADYLMRLRERGVGRVWVEKILDPGERLRDWAVCGTVGYEFLNDACALFVDPAAEPGLNELWERVSGDGRPFGAVALEAKLQQAQNTFAPEVERLARLVPTLDRDVLARGLASLPVYRTYVDPAARTVTDEDRAAVAALDPELQRMLLLEHPTPAEFVTRFQQTTPAVMAKGVEDTAFYRYGRLLALNDVGGDPSRFGIAVERFHAGCLERAQRFPFGLLTTMTHDAKRSADVRARLAALSWVPDAWTEHVGRWMSLSEKLRDSDAPDDQERYFLFQTLVGAWPISTDRIQAYMEKALREAKRNTSWVNQNPDWEQAVERFCARLCEDRQFLDDFEPFCSRVTLLGERVALAQVVLKLTSPGVPDIYQGDELWFHALVDPDNRRAVDWQWYQAMLSRLMGGSRPDRATLKLYATAQLLELRTRRPGSFLGGSYEPLEAGQTACAFLRGDDVLVAVALRSDWAGAELEGPAGRWREVFSGEEYSFARRVPLGRVLSEHGVAVFERIG
jgi:(1->4)-alpha-D-glucan 1-alpha-D-glucosylmutase